MRLCIIALGTRGDVQPCVALARGLQLAGHDVCVASERFFEPLIRSRGLRYSPVCGNAHTALQSDSMRTLLEGKRTSFFARLFARTPRRPMDAGIAQRLADCWRAGQDADATQRARSYFTGYRPSSPQIGLFKDGRLVFMLERHQIEGRAADDIAVDLTRAFDKYCAVASSV